MADTQNLHEISVHLLYIREGIDGINAHLARLNGLTDSHGQAIAVLKDRAMDARKFGAGAGAVGGGFTGVLIWLLRWLWS